MRHTAALCSVGGKLDAQRLDAHQGVCYELAFAGAELLAADITLAEAAGELDAPLALAFTAEALVTVAARLESVSLDINLETHELHALTSSRELAALRTCAASAGVLARIGQAVAGARREIGAVVLDEATTLARDAFRRFAADIVAPLAEKIHRHDLTVPEALLQPMREMGIFGLAIPEAFGGSARGGGGDTLLMIAVTEALSEASLAAAGSLITRPEILARALLAGGTLQQKARWLPQIARGEPLCAIAITEPDFGSDVASLALKARRAPGGWRLSGAKTWCTFAGKAGLLMVVARTDPDRAAGHRGLSIFLIEKPSYDGHEFSFEQPGQGGRLTGRAIPTIGYRGMHSFDLSFDELFVPESEVIGGEAGLGKGFYFTMAGTMGGRMQTTARVGRHARGLEGSGAIRAAAQGLRRAADRLPADADQDRPHGGMLCGLPATGLCDRAADGRRRRPHGSQPRQAAGLPLGRMGHARGDADSRRHGLCRGNAGQPLLRRRARAVDLRRRRRNTGLEGRGQELAGSRTVNLSPG